MANEKVGRLREPEARILALQFASRPMIKR